MKTRHIILLVLIVVPLLTASVVVAQSERVGPSSGLATGGPYQLESLRWQITGVASGGSYQLAGPQKPALTGNGCCCTYLPCLQNNAH